MTAKETRRFKPVLEAIRKDKFDEYVMNVYTKQIRERQKDTAITWDDYRRMMLPLVKNFSLPSFYHPFFAGEFDILEVPPNPQGK